MPLHLRSSIYYLLAALAAYWFLLIYQFGAQWSAYEQYNYGWAVPFLCAYLVWQRARAGGRNSTTPLPSLSSPAAGEERVAGGRVRRSPTSNFALPSSLFVFFFAALALLWLVARWLHEANPIWRLTSWVLALVVIALTLLAVRAPRSVLRLPSSVVFPLCFFLVAVPWPSGFENLLTQSFMQANVSVTTELLSFLGIPAIPKGNVIEIATGLVGVDEACSGIRSFQATLMIGLFLGELYRLTVFRRTALVLSGFALAFVFNIGRTLLLVTVASRDGIPAIAKWHDPAGVTILVGCFLGLWAIGGALRKGQPSPPRSGESDATLAHRMGEGLGVRASGEVSNSPPSDLPSPISELPTPISHLLSPNSHRRLAFALAVWFIFTEVAVQWWYRAHERSAEAHANWTFNLGGTNSGYTRIETPPNILGQFQADESTQAQWRDREGHAWQLFYFRWWPTRSLKRRVAVQLAKTHGPEICLPAAGMRLKSDLGICRLRVGDMDLALQHYEFTTEGRSVQVFYAIYEDATGGTVLANRRQSSGARVAAAVAGSRNYGQRFLELAVTGYDDTTAARAGVAEQVEKLVVVGAPVK